jgi:ABC-type uncharacterized transport system substrate-binding protein
MVNPLLLLSGFAEGWGVGPIRDRIWVKAWVRSALSCAAALGFGLMATTALAHPEGTVDCRAEVHLEGGRFQSMRAELWLDRTHTLQALGQVRAKDSKKIDPKRMELLTDSVRMQFARYQWLFDLKADGQSQKMELKSPPSLDFVDGRLRLLIDQVASVSSATSADVVPKLWTISCFDPSYYWAPAFRKSVPTATKSGSKSHDGHAEDEKDAPPDPVSGHRSIKIDKSPQDPDALKVSGCSGRRSGRSEDGVQVPRAGVAQLDWVCQP